MDRKVTIRFVTSPAELRMIAAALESKDEVRVNWYHTQFVFVAEATVGKGARRESDCGNWDSGGWENSV